MPHLTSTSLKKKLLETLYKEYETCLTCSAKFPGSTNLVFGEGNLDADIMFIGEAPGAEEDRLCKPFVGRSGQLLTKALKLCGINREDVFITNMYKSRPPGNKLPRPLVINECSELLLQGQIAIIKPKIICTLGSTPLNLFLDKHLKITQAHGKVFMKDGIPVIPTYHPAYIMRNQPEATAWLKDLCLAKEQLLST